VIVSWSAKLKTPASLSLNEALSAKVPTRLTWYRPTASWSVAIGVATDHVDSVSPSASVTGVPVSVSTGSR